MNKTKVENEFLSYVHMAASLFRIYSEKLTYLSTKQFFQEIETKLLKHEREIKEAMCIEKEGNELSLMQKMVVCMSKMKVKMMKENFDVCIETLKTIDMGIYQIEIYLKKYQNALNKEFVNNAKYVLKEYEGIAKDIRDNIHKQYL